MPPYSEIELLERRYRRWSGLHTFIVLPATLVALFSLPLSIFYQATLHPIVAAGPIVLIALAIYGQYRSQKWEASARRRIAAHYHKKYHGTRWTTPADAEGVVVEVEAFGQYLTLAFPNGLTETYGRASLTEKGTVA